MHDSVRLTPPFGVLTALTHSHLPRPWPSSRAAPSSGPARCPARACLRSSRPWPAAWPRCTAAATAPPRGTWATACDWQSPASSRSVRVEEARAASSLTYLPARSHQRNLKQPPSAASISHSFHELFPIQYILYILFIASNYLVAHNYSSSDFLILIKNENKSKDCFEYTSTYRSSFVCLLLCALETVGS